MIPGAREADVQQTHAFPLFAKGYGLAFGRCGCPLGQRRLRLQSEGGRPVAYPAPCERSAGIELWLVGLRRDLERGASLAPVETREDHDRPFEALGAVVGENRDSSVARAHMLLVGRPLLVANEDDLRRLIEVAKQPGDG